LRSNSSPEFKATGYRFEASFRAEQGQLDEAARLLEESIEQIRTQGIALVRARATLVLLVEIYRQQRRLSMAADLCRSGLAANAGMQFRMQIGGLFARIGDVEGAKRCQFDCPDLPVYRHWLCRLNGEIALATGKAAQSFAWMRQAPEFTRNAWPEYLVRAALAAGEHRIADQNLAALFGNPGRYWLEADVAPPGFVRWAIEHAPALSTSADMSRVRAIQSMLKL
jgi:hypothetical protein